MILPRTIIKTRLFPRCSLKICGLMNRKVVSLLRIEFKLVVRDGAEIFFFSCFESLRSNVMVFSFEVVRHPLDWSLLKNFNFFF
jgi:hypothetical protein